ncbi:MAG: cyclic nucleotide-binding domain-containing protein [Thermoanaerobaculia bacterium]|nr:cyclic nucleotide-binding domain-containing protein [Thermoanaerobaculia bacterium]
MAPPAPGSQDLDELVALARRFADQRRFAEAAELFGLAQRLDPKNLGVQLALAQLRRQQKAPATPVRGPREEAREEARRNVIDAAHFLGLAYLYSERGEPFRALECLEIAQAKDSGHPGPWKLAGRLLLARQDFDRAAEMLRRAARLNPFDLTTAEMLGQVEYERRQFRPALEAAIDAFLLCGEPGSERGERLRRRIRTLRQALGWENRRVVELFHERQEALRLAYERLEWRRERFREEATLLERPSPPPPPRPPGDGRLELAARIRRQEAWGHLSDEQVFELARGVHVERHAKGSRILAHGALGADIYQVEEGEILIERTTPYGVFPLATLRPGDLFGEVSFLSRGERAGDAVAKLPVTLLRFDGGALDAAVARSADLGVQVYWGLWHAVSRKLRDTNEQLRTFFPADARSENFLRLRRPDRGRGGQVAVDSTDKVRLFRESGLSNKELVTLATFSRELRFAAGELLFGEGDEGREMYVVLEGRVLISKFIPGAGEEALAILERGDFFGEMALIDGEARSADARAHGGPLTVLALDQATLREMLALDPQASLEFLRLLCRLLAKRLREIDEKVVGWRILAGPGHQNLTA